MNLSFINFLSLSAILILTTWLVFSPGKSSSQTQTSVQATDLKSGAAPIPTNTPNEEAAIRQRSTLRKLVPVTEDGFTIDYDYQKLKFVVTLSEPVLENQAKFQKWLQTFGFESIEPDRFEFLP